jgi:carbon storage regulator
MLVLSRKRDEGVVIGGDIKLTVVEVSGDRVRIGIDAPPDVRITRSELYYTEKFNIQAAVNRPAAGLIENIITGKTPFTQKPKT